MSGTVEAPVPAVTGDGARTDGDALAGAERAAPARPLLGFLGVGWIGRHRMQAIRADGACEVAALADPSMECVAAARGDAPGAAVADGLDALLEMGLDGIVVATPSALHAAQARRALQAGCAVFCQKPLGRTATEARGVVDAARAANRLLGVDLSYRHTEGMRRIREQVRAGALGRVYAAELVFHNAYGPDKPWFYDRALSGGGCVMDLGIHLVDLALWVLDFPPVRRVEGRLFAGGAPLGPDAVEDHALATLELDDGTAVRLACSWRLPAGQDAVIAAEFYGTGGGAAFRNVDGGFYEFTADRFDGTARTRLASPPDDWGGRAAAHWARRLAGGARYDPAVERVVDVAAVLDRVYGR